MRTAGLVLDVFGWLVCVGTWAAGGDKSYPMVNVAIPTLNTDNPTIDKAFRIAIGDLLGNVVPYKAGLLEQRVPVIFAGLDYSAPGPGMPRSTPGTVLR